MNIEKRTQRKHMLKHTLKQLNGGDVFYFANMSFENALKEDAVYMAISGGKDARVNMTNLSDGLVLQRDDCHDVIKLNMTMVLDTIDENSVGAA